MVERRITLGNTAKRALDMIAEHGPLPLTHGYRYARISRAGIYVMQSTNHLLRSSGMVEWAGGNYDRSHVRITEYGEECRRRGSRDPAVSVHFSDSYGPREGEELRSAPAGRQAIAHATGGAKND